MNITKPDIETVTATVKADGITATVEVELGKDFTPYQAALMAVKYAMKGASFSPEQVDQDISEV